MNCSSCGGRLQSVICIEQWWRLFHFSLHVSAFLHFLSFCFSYVNDANVDIDDGNDDDIDGSVSDDGDDDDDVTY